MKLPQTIEQALDQLEGIASLLTAKEWERAAIVYAFTADQSKGAGVTYQKKVSDKRLGINEFADLGITGLASAPTVRKYRAIWAEHGTPDIKPGDEVELPAVDWPGVESRDMTHRIASAKEGTLLKGLGARKDVGHVIAEIVRSDPFVIEDMSDDDLSTVDSLVHSTAIRRHIQHQPSIETSEPEMHTSAWDTHWAIRVAIRQVGKFVETYRNHASVWEGEERRMVDDDWTALKNAIELADEVYQGGPMDDALAALLADYAEEDK